MSDTAGYRARVDYLMLAGFCAFLFFFGLNSFGLIGADEPRYAQVAREMLARHDWITPWLGGLPWLEKPPLYYWQAMAAFAVFGVSDWSARLPAAVDATAMVLAVYFFLRRFRPGFHLDGALICASCAAVLGYARAASMDMALTATFSIALLAWYAWYENGGKFFLAGFYLSLALGLLAKGPVAPFLAGLVILVFALTKRDSQPLWRTLWLPGILLFCAVGLPWYVLVQMRNPNFFRVFILQHNLARFGTNLYHHPEPFWYFALVLLLGLLPWLVFVLAATVKIIRARWPRRGPHPKSRDEFDLYGLLWLAIPVIFFSFSRSKLPGYIVPAIPAGALLLAEYIRRRVAENDPPPRWLFFVHSLVASALIVPALTIQFLLSQHRLPWNRAGLVAALIALLVATGMIASLVRRRSLRLLRFVTLVPVVLTVAALLRMGGPAFDSVLSARPLAQELHSMETNPLPLAVLDVTRETAYGLAFYRDQVIAHYEWGQVPAGEHLLVAPESSQTAIAPFTPGRRVAHLGSLAAQHLDYYWVSAAGAAMSHKSR
jgi:4-amino-4-deoxy-L-arabinose transferase-like glycosyltransferase